MISRILALLPVVLILLLTPGHVDAQEEARALPSAREDVLLSFSPLVKKISPAVVNIYTKRVVTRSVHPFMNDPLFAPFFQDQRFGGRMKKQVEGALGSGVIVDEDGLIVTNSHVIRDATEIRVVLADGREFDTKLVLQDDASDLSLLRLETKGEKLPFASLRPSETLEVGDLVLAIGNPFGVGQTVTSGIVSALARSSLNISDFNFFIQTDAAINPGNSGGPLVALDGGVVGINSAIYSRDGGSLGIGFAIPSEMVASVIAAEKAGAGGKGITRPWVGVTAQPVTSDIADSLGLDRPMGALILTLHDGSPLAKAGVKVGDVIVTMNGKPVHDPSEMKFRMATVPLGGKTQIDVMRQGKKIAFDVEVIPPPDTPPREELKLQGAHLLNGASIANINPAVAVELGIFGDMEQGVVVLKTAPGTPSERVVSTGDILLKINGVDIKKTKDVEAALKEGGQMLDLTLSTQGQTRRLLVR